MVVIPAIGEARSILARRVIKPSWTDSNFKRERLAIERSIQRIRDGEAEFSSRINA